MVLKNVGTTKALYLQNQAGKPIQKDRDYFIIQVESTQIAFKGSFWQKLAKLIVLSKVNLNSMALGSQLREMINEPKEVKTGSCTNLNLSKTIVPCTPASMESVSITFDFLIDTENKSKQFADLINNPSIQELLSLTPIGTVTRAVGGATQALRNAFFPDEKNKPVLQFTGDFNIQAGELKEGYYVILGTSDSNYPLPSLNPFLTYDQDQLLLDHKPINNLSYVLLHVINLGTARGKELGKGRPWYLLNNYVTSIVEYVGNNTALNITARTEIWNICRILLDEMKNSLENDADYLKDETHCIYLSAYNDARDKIHRNEIAEPRSLDLDSREIELLKPLGIKDEKSLKTRVLNYDKEVKRAMEIQTKIRM